MSNIKASYLTFISCLIFCSSIFAHEPPNLGRVKLDIIHYYQSGDYIKDQTKVIKEAQNYIRHRVNENNKAANKKKLAIVMDVDETSLSNFKDYRELNFGGSEEDILEMIKHTNKSAIAPSLNLYRFAKSNDVAVFFVTGRPESMRNETIKNLKNVGYYNWNGLFMKPNNYKKHSIVSYKKLARKEIIDMGYEIIVNIGDQQSDLDGGYADKAFKIPNPFYLIR